MPPYTLLHPPSPVPSLLLLAGLPSSVACAPPFTAALCAPPPHHAHLAYLALSVRPPLGALYPSRPLPPLLSTRCPLLLPAAAGCGATPSHCPSRLVTLAGATPLSPVTHPTGGLSPVDEAQVGRPPCARTLSASHRRCAKTRDNLHQTDHRGDTKTYRQQEATRGASPNCPTQGSRPHTLRFRALRHHCGELAPTPSAGSPALRQLIAGLEDVLNAWFSPQKGSYRHLGWVHTNRAACSSRAAASSATKCKTANKKHSAWRGPRVRSPSVLGGDPPPTIRRVDSKKSLYCQVTLHLHVHPCCPSPPPVVRNSGCPRCLVRAFRPVLSCLHFLLLWSSTGLAAAPPPCPLLPSFALRPCLITSISSW